MLHGLEAFDLGLFEVQVLQMRQPAEVDEARAGVPAVRDTQALRDSSVSREGPVRSH